MNRYRIVETAFGHAALAFSVEPFRLLEVKLPQADIDSLCQPFDSLCWQIDAHHPAVASIAASLIRYFDGEPIDIPWPVMDFSRFTPSQQAVYRTVATIPYGETASYGQVARMAGFPRAARFVGTTMANNRYPVFIPCHRVIRSDGSPGGFGGGEPLKKRMLALESESAAG
ncbi:methylated-DNA--protein-cysteine methyltransferase [Desulfosarcina alkanivorans]|jgi:methylated-DNA-[protein]-cysteine S-methyltransferase|uniref:methylated-DNA--[protein]-cysteine S-methyltransferase n=1 Tax=Desulfosarcina alkanivorans TaxID=571177 RepID=A0A5K7YVI7_9BACT|nr:methylated-DNA--[protein]-cysteine S-methyltransferase [Desulfosarcina alkanivorans]BBO72023.1 methylated-DNA--protein-cysteine methyltransferase [Desulfosarcina alkanivorans]